jgi:transcription-repair coupling factor
LLFFPQNLHTDIIKHLKAQKQLTLSGTGNLNAKAFMLADLLQKTDHQTLFWIIEDPKEAQKTEEAARFWTKAMIYNFCHKSENEKPSDLERILRLYAIQKEEKKIIIADPDSFFFPLPQPKALKTQTVTLKKGEQIDTTHVINQLLENGYEFSKDDFLAPGTYCKQGGLLNIFIPTLNHPIKIESDGITIDAIFEFDQESKLISKKHNTINIVPLSFKSEKGHFIDYLDEKTVLVNDEIDLSETYADRIKEIYQDIKAKHHPSVVTLTAFPEEDDTHYFYLYYLSILKFQDVFDFLNDLREKKKTNWKIQIFTKHFTELTALLTEEKITFSSINNPEADKKLFISDASHIKHLPQSFQNAHLQTAVVTDREIFDFKQIKRKASKIQRKVYLEFVQKLKDDDFVVHVDHGIGKFMGIDTQEVDGLHREYLKIGYAENDKLYVPIDQAEKVNKYIGFGQGVEPKLTRLGSGEWSAVTGKVKKETQKIAKELLELYAKREMSKGHTFFKDDNMQDKFEKDFKYEPTPGQIRAFMEVKKDMENEKPMDRLVCGDVGFGKTEVAMRAAFKAFRNGKQVAVITPITILTHQHCRSFTERMQQFGPRVEMISRFKTPAEQREILKKLSKGEIDIIIGTHRLLQPDVQFKDLGLLIVDEEQRFGVKQKEQIKGMRAEVDILTLTATPIPRTLNMSLNKLRDITVITTPPPGRLPIISEVRRFSETLIKESVDREIARSGQVYFLHNRVQTIESMASKLRTLFPNLRILVAHGKLPAQELEKRIIAFKEKEYDILVSSTIIENGIDLPNANTMIINNTENFGLSQLYQLRGRIGRGKVQAYAYFLYHAQRLKPEAKRRLRAIVEASELGAGFQIAMHDLEIRGAGDILGANQAGSMSVVGVSHFVRLLQMTIAELKAGKASTKDLEDIEKITIDLPLTAYIPDWYIQESREKINAYQRLSSSTTFADLTELKQEFAEDYGKLPKEVSKLFEVLEVKILSRNADITALRSIIAEGNERQLVLTMGKSMQPIQIGKLLQQNPKWEVAGTTLKIRLKKLGFNWLEGLKASLKAMEHKEEKSTKVTLKKGEETTIKETANNKSDTKNTIS